MIDPWGEDGRHLGRRRVKREGRMVELISNVTWLEGVEGGPPGVTPCCKMVLQRREKAAQEFFRVQSDNGFESHHG